MCIEEKAKTENCKTDNKRDHLYYYTLYELIKSADLDLARDLNNWILETGYNMAVKNSREPIIYGYDHEKAFDIGKRIVKLCANRIKKLDEFVYAMCGQEYLKNLFNTYDIEATTAVSVNGANYFNLMLARINKNFFNVWYDDKDEAERLAEKWYLNDEEFAEFVKICISILQGNLDKIDTNNFSDHLLRNFNEFKNEYEKITDGKYAEDPEFIAHLLNVDRDTINSPIKSAEFCIQEFLKGAREHAVMNIWAFIGKMVESRKNIKY